MAEQLVKLFQKEIQKNLFPDNAFYKQSRLDGGIDVNAKTVEIPQSGSLPGIVENPTVFPLAISQRVDDTLTYSVDLLATLPIHVQDVNLAVINYDKRKDILEDHVMSLNTRVAEKIVYSWAVDGSVTPGNVVLTTGAARPSSFGGADKKRVTYADFVKIDEIMTSQDVPEEGRCALIPAAMYSDLLQIEEFISKDYKNVNAVNDGAVGEILGIKIFKRSSAVNYQADGITPQVPTYNATTGVKNPTPATTKAAIIAWHKSFVRRAEGKVKVYADTDKPEYLGSVYNASVRTGGTKGRTDGKGVVVLVQDEA